MVRESSGRPPSSASPLQRFDRWLYQGGRPNFLARLMNQIAAVQHSTGLILRHRLVTLEVSGRRTGRVISVPLVVADLEGRRYRTGCATSVPPAGGRCCGTVAARSYTSTRSIPGPVRPSCVATSPSHRAPAPISRWIGEVRWRISRRSRRSSPSSASQKRQTSMNDVVSTRHGRVRGGGADGIHTSSLGARRSSAGCSARATGWRSRSCSTRSARRASSSWVPILPSSSPTRCTPPGPPSWQWATAGGPDAISAAGRPCGSTSHRKSCTIPDPPNAPCSTASARSSRGSWRDTQYADEHECRRQTAATD